MITKVNMRSIIIIIIILCVMNVNVNARHHNYARQIEKSIIVACNIHAFHETKNEVVYKCIVEKNENCNIITGYNKYNKIMYNCIDDKHSECGTGVFITIIICFLIAICNLH
jgi:hypothetical protein